MKPLFRNIIVYLFIFLQFGCGGFINPFGECFLDWNMNCLDQKNNELFDSGYKFSYPGEPNKAKSIFLKCSQISKNLNERESCLLKNGFRKYHP